jgi:hemoglobin
MMRRRHFPFAIDELARDRWLMCMEKALRSRADLPQEPFEQLMSAFTNLASHMVNR